MLIAIIVGYVVGFVINVVADALPPNAPLNLLPRCVYCGTTRDVRQWSGVLAWLTGRRRCRSCGRELRWRWAVVEIVTPLIFAYLFAQFGPPELTIFSSRLFSLGIYSATLLLVSVIDFEHRLILRVVIFPAIALAGALSFATPGLSPVSAFIGGVSGFALTGLIYLGGILFVAMQARRGRSIREVAFGQGDVWLMLFVGLITGFPGVLRALALGVLIGGLAAVAILIFGAVRRESKLYVPFAYGPYLAVAGWITLLQNALASSQ